MPSRLIKLPCILGRTRPAEYVELPKDLLRRLPEMHSLAELAVVLYVCWHTYGFHEYESARALTLDEFELGRKKSDGTHMDGGTGLSRASIKLGLKQAIDDGFLYAVIDAQDKARIVRWFALKLSSDETRGLEALPLDHPGLPEDEARGIESDPQRETIHPSTEQHRSPRGVESSPRSEKETRERNGEKQPQKENVAASPRSPDGSPVLSEEDEEEAQEKQPNLVMLRTEYATLSQQLEQLDAKKQAGQWARLYKQVQAAEARLRYAEQDTPPSPAEPTEYAKQAEAQASEVGAASPTAEVSPAGERHEQLRAIASDLISWLDGLKVLRQAQLPKWRGSFKWQIETKIELLQTEYARCVQRPPNQGARAGLCAHPRAAAAHSHLGRQSLASSQIAAPCPPVGRDAAGEAACQSAGGLLGDGTG